MEFRPRALEMDGLKQMERQRPFHARRSGAALLGLLVASNFLPWTELLTGKTAAAELAGREEIVAGVGSCFIAAGAVFAAWLIGRRGPSSGTPRIPRPRTLGLRLTMLAVSANLVIAGLLRAVGGESGPGDGSRAVFSLTVWFLMVLPLELAAAYFNGRASDRALTRDGVAIDHTG